MGDIEEHIFKQNIPGKYSRWNEEADDARNESDDDDRDHEIDETTEYSEFEDRLGASEDVIHKVLNSNLSEHVKDGILNERFRKPNTGVKGVLADYKANKALKLAEQQARVEQRNAILTRIVQGARIANTEAHQLEEENTGNHSSGDEEEEDEFLAEYRQKRLQELRQHSNLPVFGLVKEISSADFVEEVERVDPRVFVVVHLYETGVSSCVRLNRFLEEIAIQRKDMKFLRMNATHAGIALDKVALPILNIYRGGESIDVIAGIANDYGEFFTMDDVSWLLDHHTSNK